MCVTGECAHHLRQAQQADADTARGIAVSVQRPGKPREPSREARRRPPPFTFFGLTQVLIETRTAPRG